MSGLPSGGAHEATPLREMPAVKQLEVELRIRYQRIFDLVELSEKETFGPTDVQEIFSRARDWLQVHDDPSWGAWRIEFNEKTSLSVSPGIRRINIAGRREPVTREEARGLLAHELLVHAVRANNGHRAGDKKLASGLPDYIDAEEGLAILAEVAINGRLPDKAVDRYIDIALALGAVDG